MKRICVFSAVLAGASLVASVNAEITRPEVSAPRSAAPQPRVPEPRPLSPVRPEPQPRVQPPKVCPPLLREPRVQLPEVCPPLLREPRVQLPEVCPPLLREPRLQLQDCPLPTLPQPVVGAQVGVQMRREANATVSERALQQRAQNAPVAGSVSAETVTRGGDIEAQLRGQGAARTENARDIVAHTTRLRMAARERRAEISEMRDRALATGDAQALLRAQRAEQALNAFVAAQARVQANTEGKPAPGILPTHPPVANPIPEPPMSSASGVTTVGGSETDADTTTTTTADAVQPAS